MNLPMTRLRNARQRGTATPIQWTSAQARTPANRMTALLIRRFRVRAPDAPHSPSWDNLGPARPALGRVVETIDPQLRRTQCTQRTAREHGQSPIALGGGLSPAAVPRRDIGKQSHAEPDAGPAQPALLTPRRQVRDGDASHLTSPLSAHRRLVRYRQVVGDGLWAAVQIEQLCALAAAAASIRRSPCESQSPTSASSGPPLRGHRRRGRCEAGRRSVWSPASCRSR